MKAMIACGVCGALWIIAIIILIGIIGDSLKNSASIQTRFDESTAIFSKRIDETLNNSISIMSMVVSLASVVPRLDNRTFVEYLNGYLNHSHSTTSTVIWAEAVRNATEQTAIMRDEGFTNYTITSPNIINSISLPLTYVYPYNLNVTLRGFDLLSDPMRQVSLIKANLTQVVTATPAIQGLNNNTQLRISIYDPVFNWKENCLKGMVYQNFFLEPFIIASLEDIDNSTLQVLWFDVTDDAMSMMKMYQLNENSPDIGQFSYNKESYFAGRRWIFMLKNINTITTSQKITTGSVIGALILIAVIILVVTVVFIRNQQNLIKKNKAAKLLNMVVPEHITNQLTEHLVTLPGGKSVLKGQTMIAQAHRRVGLCFIDICNFTIISSALTPGSLVRMLDEFFTLIDELLDRHNEIIKIKTIGDAYFAVSGLASIVHPGTSGISNADDVEKSVDSRRSSLDTTNLLSLIDFCISIQEKLQGRQFHVVQSEDCVQRRKADISESSTEEARCLAVLDQWFAESNSTISLQVRIGVHVGDIVAGVVGKKQPQYDVWGSACNIAARMESTAPLGQIQVSQQVVDALKSSGFGDLFKLEKRRVSLKGIGRVDAFSLQLDNDEVKSIMQEADVKKKTKKKSRLVVEEEEPLQINNE